MHAITLDDVDAFLRRAERFLLAREAEHGLPLGLAYGVRRHGGRAFFAVALDDHGEVAVAALQTPPHGLVLTGGPEQAVRALAGLAKERGLSLPGAVGPEDAVRAFGDAWREATGRAVTTRFEQTCYVATSLRPPPGVAGALRRAEPGDLSFVAETIAGFAVEVGVGPPELDRAAAAARARIEAGELYLWEDETPVSVAGLCRPTPAGVSVNAVFTPHAARGRRYAQACVAALSQRALDGGKRFVTLFADRKNAISNRVYRAIGFEPVRDVLQLDFQ